MWIQEYGLVKLYSSFGERQIRIAKLGFRNIVDLLLLLCRVFHFSKFRLKFMRKILIITIEITITINCGTMQNAF